MFHSILLACMSICANTMLSLLLWQIETELIPLTLFFLFRIALDFGFWIFLCVNMNIRVASYNSVIDVIEAFREIALSF